MKTHQPNQATEIPAHMIVRGKPSRRGMRARAMALTAKPKARTVSWAVAESFAPANKRTEPAPIETRIPVGDA